MQNLLIFKTDLEEFEYPTFIVNFNNKSFMDTATGMLLLIIFEL